MRRDTLGASNPDPRPDHTTQVSNARKINSHNFCLYKLVGVGVTEETANFQETLLKGQTYINLPTLGFSTNVINIFTFPM